MSSSPNSGSRGAYAWLWLLVAIQVAIPASYYLVREDKDDERFAWRMFSATRVKTCQVRLREQRGGRFEEQKLEPLLHGSWRAALARGRRRVIENFVAKRCRDDASIEVVELSRSCRNVERERHPVQRARLACREGRWTFEGMPP